MMISREEGHDRRLDSLSKCFTMRMHHEISPTRISIIMTSTLCLLSCTQYHWNPLGLPWLWAFFKGHRCQQLINTQNRGMRRFHDVNNFSFSCDLHMNCSVSHSHQLTYSLMVNKENYLFLNPMRPRYLFDSFINLVLINGLKNP